MTALRLSPVVLSCLLLAAHFYRGGPVLLAAGCAALPFLLLLHRSWVPPLFRVLLVLGAIEWLHTLYALAAMRMAWGEPWGRLAAILGSVALLTGLSALVFRDPALKARYNATQPD